MVKKFILLVLILLFLCNVSFAQHKYYYFTGAPITVAWDAVINAVGYTWQLRRISDSVTVIQGATELVTVTFNVQSAGTYVFYCNAWNYEEDGITRQYSEWATSLTYGVVDGVVTPWEIIIELKPVGPLLFDYK